MPAWTVKNAWTANTIQTYRNYAGTNGPHRAGNLRSTCEDLSIRMVVDFAEQHGLPVFFGNNSNPQGLDPAKYNSKAAYLDAVLPSTGASDLLTYNTVVMVKGAQKGNANVSLPLAKPGDLIILYAGGGHVQVVTSVSPGKVNIVQGNFRPSSERCNVLKRKWYGLDQNDPSSSCYIGAIVAQVSYVRSGTPPKWLFGGNRDVFSDEGRLCIWDFNSWNNFVPNFNPAKATTP
ncbi:hypothetical protein C5Y96_05170 [Blastopirellula marina]|uniref:Uncharacterized protein n=1 Tax=Blastopirellula marina TaxID=124 RepID=A0A2S8G4N4_9BACT|nr:MULTISPECIES: CHAP domain-containing protein [Pirellulaceae]PQO39250.1 hypothetical protein C5Y96_05170 [Blastopirellula marina]RCS55558.1 CHAP domain-containing protein [Bremerella cremea]